MVVGSVRQNVETYFTCLPVEERWAARHMADHFLATHKEPEWDDLRALRTAQRKTEDAN